MRMYLNMLQKVLRPSITPSSRTSRRARARGVRAVEAAYPAAHAIGRRRGPPSKITSAAADTKQGATPLFLRHRTGSPTLLEGRPFAPSRRLCFLNGVCDGLLQIAYALL